MTVLIPLAGNGTRFKDSGYGDIKPLIEFNDQTMIENVIGSLGLMEMDYKCIFIIQKEHNLDGRLENTIVDRLPTAIVVEIDGVTEGSVCTCLLAKNYIDLDDELMITNCDQMIHDFNLMQLSHYARVQKADGVLGVFNCLSEKNSYVALDDDYNATEVREKEIISRYATNGVHFWTKAKYFINSAREMMEANDRVNGEFYVAPTYNYLIDRGMTIKTYHYNHHYPIGTPEDLEYYIKEIS